MLIFQHRNFRVLHFVAEFSSLTLTLASSSFESPSPGPGQAKMRSLTSVTAAGLLLVAAHAMPNAIIQPRATDAALEPWVTVNDDGKPSTVTPVSTTISGTPTVLSGAPHDVTATVFTYTSYGKIVTSTGLTPPAPTATGTKSAGSFALCNNLDGDLAPWCRPDGDTPLYVGTTYYCTSSLTRTRTRPRIPVVRRQESGVRRET